jgi:hypothetical protein
MNATTIFDALTDLPDDILADGHDDTPPQEREALGEWPLSSCGNRPCATVCRLKTGTTTATDASPILPNFEPE